MNFDEIYSSGYSNLTYLDVEHRRLREAADLLDVSVPLTVERDLPICRVWQLGSRGRLELLAGRLGCVAEGRERGARGAECAACPHVAASRARSGRAPSIGGDGADDLDAAWALAQRYGEMIRLLPACAALVERVWLTGCDDERVATAATLLAADVRPGLEWARGDLAVWMRRLDPDVAVPRPRLAGGAVSPAAHRPAPRGGGVLGFAVRPVRASAWRSSTPATPRTHVPVSICSTGSAPTRSRRRFVSSSGTAASVACRRAEKLDARQHGGAHRAGDRGAAPAAVRLDQRRNGRAPVHLAEDGRSSRLGDHLQAARSKPPRGRPRQSRVASRRLSRRVIQRD